MLQKQRTPNWRSPRPQVSINPKPPTSPLDFPRRHNTEKVVYFLLLDRKLRNPSCEDDADIKAKNDSGQFDLCLTLDLVFCPLSWSTQEAYWCYPTERPTKVWVWRFYWEIWFFCRLSLGSLAEGSPVASRRALAIQQVYVFVVYFLRIILYVTADVRIPCRPPAPPLRHVPVRCPCIAPFHAQAARTADLMSANPPPQRPLPHRQSRLPRHGDPAYTQSKTPSWVHLAFIDGKCKFQAAKKWAARLIHLLN